MIGPSTLGAEIHGALGEYVYGLEDPRDGHLFYVGRGIGDRVLNHSRAALASDEPGAKLDRIRAIHDANLKPRAYILRRRLGKLTAAAEVEAMSTPEEKCIGAPEQNYITDDGSQAPRTGRLAVSRSCVGRAVW